MVIDKTRDAFQVSITLLINSFNESNCTRRTMRKNRLCSVISSLSSLIYVCGVMQVSAHFL